MKALKASLQLKHEFPNCSVKLREADKRSAANAGHVAVAAYTALDISMAEEPPVRPAINPFSKCPNGDALYQAVGAEAGLKTSDSGIEYLFLRYAACCLQ